MPIVNVLDLTSKEEALLTSILKETLYGAAMAERINSASDGAISYKAESLYPALAKLLRRGWATAKWGDDLEGARRRYYTITESGLILIAKKRTFLLRISDIPTT
jgi:PadR family transcriptional regulator PadR